MLQSFDIKRVTVDGIEVAYSVVGEGKKLAFMCQGWGTNFKMYKIVADAIGDEYRTVLFDFPGFGMTAESPEPWDVPQYTEFFKKFLAAVVNETALRDDFAAVPEEAVGRLEGRSKISSGTVSLIGHSFGGRVIIEYASNVLSHRFEQTSTSESPAPAAERCPEPVEGACSKPTGIDKIVLIDSAGVMPEHDSSHNFRVKAYKIGKKILTNKFVHSLFPEVIDDWMSRQGSADYRAASPMMKKVLVKAVNYDQQHLMDKISAPTLLIWGENDDATPLNDAKIMEQKFQDAGLVVIPGTGHFSYAENPALFTSVIRAFLIPSAEVNGSPAPEVCSPEQVLDNVPVAHYPATPDNLLSGKGTGITEAPNA